MDNDSYKRRLFQKFINGECDEAEREQVMAYLEASEVPEEFDALMKENFEQKLAANTDLPAGASDRMYRHLQARMAEDKPKAKSRSFSIFSYMAAAVLLLLLLGVSFFYSSIFDKSEQMYATTYGETREIQLPDGSRVVLNANSRLTFQNGWNEALAQQEDFVREVWLEGEGIFEVEKLDKPSRFVVHTQGLQVEVLGTTFNVNARSKKTRVVLDEGEVKVKTADQSEMLMQPGDLVEVVEDAPLQKRQVNPEHYMSWRHNELVFEATPLTEVTEILKNNYGFEVTVRQQAVTPEMLFTGKVPADNTELLLKMLSESFNIRIIQEDKQLIFQH